MKRSLHVPPAVLLPMRLALLALLATVAVGACSIGGASAGGGSPNAISVDRECNTGLAFAQSYALVRARFDPGVENDRSALAASSSVAGSQVVLRHLAADLASYDEAIAQLHAPVDYSDGLAAVLTANQGVQRAALALASGDGRPAAETAFQSATEARRAAVHNLDLQLGFLTSECQ